METTTQTTRPTEDKILSVFEKIANFLVVIPLGLIPILFIPGTFVPFTYNKIFPIIVCCTISLVFLSLVILRRGTLIVPFSWTLIVLWGVVAVSVVSALFSGDFYDSFINDSLSVQSVGFLLLMATVSTLVALMCRTKSAVMMVYTLLVGSGALLGLYHLVRIVFGANFLSFGVFGDLTSSPIGGWNELALFFGLSIIVSLVVLEQLPLTKWGRFFFVAVTLIAILMLMIVNFFAVWIVLALVSLVVLMYTLIKDRTPKDENEISMKQGSTTTFSSVATSTAVFVVSMTFIVGGGFVGSLVSNITDISYVEVRPSVSATIDIAANVYQNDLLLGSGPGTFAEAWRLYKDPSLNQTIFWDTNFQSGNSYFFTQFITHGVLGAVAWLTFLGLFLLTGFRLLLRTAKIDKVWYFIASSSFVAALYLWGMSFLYAPGASTLLLASLFTGITLAVHLVTTAQHVTVLTVFSNRVSSFGLVAVVMVMIIGSSLLLYGSGRHFAAAHVYASAVSSEQTDVTIEEVEERVLQAYSIMASDTYLNRFAQYQLLKVESLAGLTEPTAEQQQLFDAAISDGVTAARQAISQDDDEPRNWVTLARFYTALAALNVEGAANLAQQTYEQLGTLLPNNPGVRLQEAELAARIGDVATARAKINEAISLKSNYADAFFLLAQIEVQEGNTAEAVSAAEAMVSLDPENPARLYQLGILYSSNEDIPSAIAAFEQAVALNRSFSNARYFLALNYVEIGEVAAAIEQLEVVEELNPGNEQVAALLTTLRSGDVEAVTTQSDPITETGSVTTDEETVVSDGDTETPLIVPVNTPPADNDAESETQ